MHKWTKRTLSVLLVLLLGCILLTGCTSASPWNVSSAEYVQSFDISIERKLMDVFFKYDGSEMYVLGAVWAPDVYQFTLSTPWDVTTATYTQGKWVLVDDACIEGLFFKPDGTKMYINVWDLNKVQEWTLSTPWDISTASYIKSYTISSGSSDVFFNPDGDKMYVSYNTGYIKQYTLSTPWDISTASYIQGYSVGGTTRDVFFKPDGTKMYATSQVPGNIKEYDLSTPWNVTTASYVQSFSVNDEDAFAVGLFFKSDGKKMYVAGYYTDTIYQYQVNSPGTILIVTVKDAVTGANLSDMEVRVADSSSSYIAGGVTDANGIYDSSQPIDYALEPQTGCYVEAFDSSLVPDYGYASVEDITLVDGNNYVTVYLQPISATLIVTVKDAVTGATLEGMQVLLADSTSLYIAGGVTDANGIYDSSQPIDYALEPQTGCYIEVYDSSSVPKYSYIRIEDVTLVVGVNYVTVFLQPIEEVILANLIVTVRDAVTDDTLEDMQVLLADSTGLYVAGGVTDANGTYDTSQPIYYVVEPQTGYFVEAFDYNETPAYSYIRVEDITLVSGVNYLTIYLQPIEVQIEVTTLHTDKLLYNRSDTVRFTYNIATNDWSVANVYDIQVLKGVTFLGVVAYWSSYDTVSISQIQSGTVNWVVTEQGVYKANLRSNQDKLVESNQFTVAEAITTPTGKLDIMDSTNITIPKSTFNISETIVLNVTDMNMAGNVVIREKGFYPPVKVVFITSSGLYNITIDYAGFFEATLQVTHLGVLIELDSEEFNILEDKDFAYITIRSNVELAKGETLYFWAYSPETANMSIYNPNNETVVSKQSMVAGDLYDFTYQIPANAIEGVYTIKLTNATDDELVTTTFRVVGDIYNWVQWDEGGYWLAEVGDDNWVVSDSVVTSFSYANIYQGVKIVVEKMEIPPDGSIPYLPDGPPIFDVDYHEPKNSGQEVIEIGTEGVYQVSMWQRYELLGKWFSLGLPITSQMEVKIPEAGQIIDGKEQDPKDKDEVGLGGLFALYPIFEPWEKIFGRTIGKGMFAIMVIAVIDLTLAGAGIAMSVIGLMSLLMVLVFVWVGLLPLFVGILLVILGSIQIVKMYTGGR